jgi:hypothetical protein
MPTQRGESAGNTPPVQAAMSAFVAVGVGKFELTRLICRKLRSWSPASGNTNCRVAMLVPEVRLALATETNVGGTSKKKDCAISAAECFR